jgi:GntR family transcriptional regulator
LRHQGLIDTLKGKGTFVKTRPFLKRNIHEYFLFHTDPQQASFLHGKTIMIEKQKPQLSSAHRVLNLTEGDTTYLIKKVLFHDYFPIALGEYYFPVTLFPNLPAKPYHNIHLFNLIEEVFHHRVEAYDAAFSAGTLREDVALVLDTPKGSVAHTIRLKVLDDTQRVLAYAIIHVPGDYVSYEVRSYD